MIIYKTTNLINNKIYIGKDSKNNPLYLGSGKILNQAIKKYGIDNFKKEILEECNESIVDNREIYWIDYYNARDRSIGYNIAKGGSGGDTISSHPRKKEIGESHSKKLKGKDSQRTNKGPLSNDTKKKISTALTGTNNPMYGKKHSVETKQKISAIQKNRDPSTRIVSNETKQKISVSNKGKTLSAETKQKISMANSGINNGFYGKTHSEENLRKFRESGRRPKSPETKEKLRSAMLGKYYGKQNKPFIANDIIYNSIGDCFKSTNEPKHKIRNKIKSGIYVYVIQEVV